MHANLGSDWDVTSNQLMKQLDELEQNSADAQSKQQHVA
jgi:hypothetical protein